MADLGKKYTCYSCHTKFYDLGKPEPLCPKCGADQRDADDKPVVTSRKGRVAPPPPVIEEPEFEPEAEAEPAVAAGEGDEDEEVIAPVDGREEEAEEEEEDY